MRRTSRVLVALTAAVAVGSGQLAAWSAPSAAVDPVRVAAGRIDADTTGHLTLRPDGSGGYDFLGVAAGSSLDNPGVTPSTSVVDAAAAALGRYGAAFGTDRPGTTLTQQRATETVTGDAVRYQQHVGGLPVLGGELVVSLRPDRELDSILAHASSATKVRAAVVTEDEAAATAQASFQRAAGRGAAASVTEMGRWVVDPALIGASPSLPVRTAWRFELRRGAAERRIVLVDDQSGMVLMDNDLIAEAENRVVCDNANVSQNPNAADAPCVNASVNLVRTEAGAPAALAEANTAFDLGGVVWSNYLAFGGLDLTNLIGRVVDGGSTKALAQTVRWCYTGFTCPYANAFWNGSQMYYGQGYAVADDVVGHEMTHGVTERTSNLMYWGQSGAMNESISDILGEIIDHRNVTGADVPATAWALGEDLPGFPTGLRNVQDPTLKGDPDRTSSPLYVNEGGCSSFSCYPDEDGVHSNSGVGNKTFFLASQGGTFNGQTITGIDVGDATLTRSAKLWLLVDQSLTSGSDYADEAAVLDQSCAALQGAGVMIAANCAAVHQATLATELRNTPVNNPQPADATLTCANGTTPRALFESETGTPSTKFVAGPGWARDGTPVAGQDIAHSGPEAWSNDESSTTGQASLTVASPIALPAGQPSYLFFQQWRVLDYDAGGFYDGGTVEVNGAPTAAMSWVNGPSETMFSGFGNPIPGQKAFGGDSRGYLASRLDLSGFAGTSVAPRFTMNTDSSIRFLGWFVDDIVVYTCDPVVTPPPPPPTPQPSSATGVKAKGKLGKAVVTWGAPASNPAAVTGYRVTTKGKNVTVAASVRKAVVKGLKQGTSYTFTVQALGANGFVAPSSQATAKGTEVTLKADAAKGRTSLTGKLLRGSKGLQGVALKVLTKKNGKWVKVDKVTTGKHGKYAVKLPGTSDRKYVVRFGGGKGLMGSESPSKHP